MKNQTQNLRKKKTKIVATIGPASSSVPVLKKMILGGLNIARMNFSHGSQEEHLEKLKNIRAAAKATKKRIGILQDLAGPKIRLGVIDEPFQINPGDKIILTTKKCASNRGRVFVNYAKLHNEVKKGISILIEDGTKRLEVLDVIEKDIYCIVRVGGILKSRKGVNVPEGNLSLRALTSKDKNDALFGIKHNVDFMALSFVRSHKDVLDLKKYLAKHNCSIPIISKIETPQALEDIEKIIEVSDAIMVARGDLAVEIGAENVPHAQKTMISLARLMGKPVITATQMLQSMEESPVPTRAEVSDVSNAILDGSDAVMLSNETAVGDFPIETIQTMSRIAKTTEDELYEMIPEMNFTDVQDMQLSTTSAGTLTYHAIEMAENLQIDHVVTLTQTGRTPRMMARFRPSQHIIACCESQIVCDQLTLVHGTTSLNVSLKGSREVVIKRIISLLKKKKMIRVGEKVVLTAGAPFGKQEATSSVYILEI